MKALSVTQPWASVLCAGIKDVENRLWQAAKAPGRILIHATKTKVPSNWDMYPDDYSAEIRNARLMGWIPEYSEMPYGSVIGYLDCYKIVKDSDSFWAQPDSFHWCVRDAYLFDTPIPDIKGVRGHLFDVDVDENNLPPAHKVELRQPDRQGSHIVMPASDSVIAAVEAGEKEIVYAITRLNEWLYYDEEGNQYETTSIEFVGKDKTVKKDVAAVEVFSYGDQEGKEIHYQGFDGADLVWCGVAIALK